MSVVKVVLAEGAGKWRIEDSAGNGNDGARLDDAMITLLRREFVVELGVEEAWAYLARVEEWPSWARHIRRVEVRPAGELGPRVHGASVPEQRDQVGVAGVERGVYGNGVQPAPELEMGGRVFVADVPLRSLV